MYHQLSIWEEQKNPIVRMHNHLITANLGYFELLSMRIFLLMIAKLKWDDKDLLPIRINLSDILPSYKGGDHLQVIIKACDELKEKMKDIRILSINSKGKQVYERMTVIDNVKYVEDTDYIEAEFGRKIKPYLIDLKENFTQTELQEIIKLKSTHAIRIYLLIKTLYRSGQIYTTTVNDLKLMLLGTTERYREYKEFKKFILKQTQTALDNTTAAFDFEEERKGRAIETLYFKPKNQPKYIVANSNLTDSTKAILEAYQVNLSRINEMLADGEVTEAYILYVVDIKLKDKKVKKPGGAIYKAIIEKHLWTDFEKNKAKPKKLVTTPKVAPAGTDHVEQAIQVITMAQAEQMYAEEKKAGTTKWPFAGYVKGLKTGRSILVDGFVY
ncbi:replication initiation protein [Rhodocytophaga aerolata]|uniref:Replication initiation protein n=1 Tax=Rhodocytophaga aerolata TaxID=455078 RepID=A0ABT8RFQ6_9BACT|nr:replication initiation protein [Rhodocytophaga aerolata]MDO1449547.1 replication initiation protein [Rhodocytophaga aerolata]